MLDYVLTDKMINVVAEISEKVRELELRKEFETKPYLKRANRIKSIQSTLALDGIEISEDNIRKLTDNRIRILRSRLRIPMRPMRLWIR